MDCAVSICGLPALARTLWTVLSASVGFLLQPGHYGLCSQHLWTSCCSQDIMDCAVRICGLPAPVRTLWTVLSASVDFLLQPGHYGLCCQHLWTSCSSQDIWTVLSASVDFLPQPTHYGLSYMIQAATFCSQQTNKQTKLAATLTAVGVLTL
jgi:hypothetical protein